MLQSNQNEESKEIERLENKGNTLQMKKTPTYCKIITRNVHKTTSKDLEEYSQGNNEQIEDCSCATRKLKIQKGKGLQRVLEGYSSTLEAPFHTKN